ncbi:bromodomain-containing protein 8 [Sitophilus oryzae]|uniref:Bromodomain-containing protein 8 n=1 Tax=Sitophilus oryzae TaxID=7048 RepID=A0A6J2YTC6_SITOR|nr:bromodomain-containing protein 8 [Sitophilus oryzae]
MMSTIQERLQLKREPLDKWSIREQLCLASAVARSGDQNWMSVSRALKPFGEPNRPADWFHQKNCAAQYGALLGNVETPKRKKRISGGVETGIETPAECILKRLLAERQAELKKLLADEKAEFQKLQEHMKLLQSGKITEEQLDKWCKEIDEEEQKSQQEAAAHSKWLKQRDLKKQEIERAWRPLKSPYPVAGQKRKLSDGLDEFGESEFDDSNTQQYQQHQQQPPHYSQHHVGHIQIQESSRPALSPLLTSLLKSPSQVPNVSAVSTSILHSAITSQGNQQKINPQGSAANPTIASLLNSSAGVSVSASLQQLVSTAIGQDQSHNHSQPLDTDMLDDEANLKIDDLANSILVQDGPLPEIKKEEVDDIISEIIENAQDIVADPDQHLQLDGNGDININLELDDLDEEVISLEEPPKKDALEVEKPTEKPVLLPVVDPFEFQEDPVLFQSPTKPSAMKQDSGQYVPLYQQQSPVKIDESKKLIEKPETPPVSEGESEERIIEHSKPTQRSKSMSGSVEIVEVQSEEQASENKLNKSQIQSIVHSNRVDQEAEKNIEQLLRDDNFEDTPLKDEKMEDDIKSDENEVDMKKNENLEEPIMEMSPALKVEEDDKANMSIGNSSEVNLEGTISSDLVDELYGNVNMEVKIDKTGKTRRDYSRNKKKEDKSFDMFLTVEKTDQSETTEESLFNIKREVEKKEFYKNRLKSENERSNSPWTEEEDNIARGAKRRYSTPGTPIDSLPNSPASSSFYDDDKDYRNWKKSVMLVYNRLASNKYASLFSKPITDDQAPGYSTLVYRPMDLLTIKKNIDNGVIRTSLEFKRDVMLMFTNAIMYNKTNDLVYSMALQMQQESMNPIEILLQAQGQVDAPLRRETRTSESSCKRKKVAEDVKIKKKKED